MFTRSGGFNFNGTIDEVRLKAVSPLTDFSFDFQDLLFHPVAMDAPPR